MFNCLGVPSEQDGRTDYLKFVLIRKNLFYPFSHPISSRLQFKITTLVMIESGESKF